MSDSDKYRKYAERVKLFNGLTPEQTKGILKCGQKFFFAANANIFHEGTPGSYLFIVLSGEVGIYKGTTLIAKCGQGDAFGEMAILNNAPRNATAAALQDTKVLTLSEREINQLLTKEVAVRLLLNIVHVLSERLELANASNADLRKRLRTASAT